MTRMRSDNRNVKGFTLVEVMVSITVFLLGVISAGAVMISVQQAAFQSENRYCDNADLRVKVESLRTQLGPSPLSALEPLKKFKISTGHDVSGTYELQAAGLPNLIRVELSVMQDNGASPIQFVTYLRADDA